MASSPNSPHERDVVEEATARAEKRNEGGRHTTPKGYRSHPREQPVQRGQRVSAATEPNPRAEAALRAMGAAGPPMPPAAAEAAAGEEEGGEGAPTSPSSGTALAERASEGVAGSMLKPGEKFMGKK